MDISNRHRRYFDAAFSVALAAPGVGGKKHNNFRLGAIIVANKQIVAAKFNCLKSHPKLLKHFQWPYCHAEAYAILSLGLNNCADKDLYVVRIHRNNQLALAKPCNSCMALIKQVAIANIYYSTNEGEYIKENLK